MIKRNTWIMLTVLALLLALTYLLDRTGDGTELAEVAPTQPAKPALLGIGFGEIRSLRIANLDGKAVVIESSEGGWFLSQPGAAAELVDQAQVDALITQLIALRPLTTGEINAPLSAVQLEYAPYSLTLRTVDDETILMSVGELSPTGNGYYVSVEDGGVQLVARNLIDQLVGFLENPPLLPTPIPVDATLQPR